MKKGFTLIELLVVITIIGILATGATALYTGSQQKARDSIRVSDIETLDTAATMYYTDSSVVPNNTTTALSSAILTDRLVTTGGYMDKLPSDPNPTSATTARYVYVQGPKNSVNYQVHEFNAKFESTSNATRASGDGGNGSDLFEKGTDTANLGLSAAAVVSPATVTTVSW